MKKKVALRKRIESARQKLYDLALQYGFGHKRVLKQSMVLDELINQYNRNFYAHIKKPPA